VRLTYNSIQALSPVRPQSPPKALPYPIDGLMAAAGVEPDRLALLSPQAGQAERPRAIPPAIPSAPPHNRILVVDDMPSSLVALQDALMLQGYQVEVAQDARQAMRQLREAPPDLLLMDVVLPGMDGYEVVQQLRKNPNQPFTPVLFITASEPQTKRLQKLRSGAMDVVSKSIDPTELLERVRDLLALKQGMDRKTQFEQTQEDDIWVMSDAPSVAVEQMLAQIRSGALGKDLSTVRRYLESLAMGNRTMVATLNQVLNIYQYESGCKSLNLTPLNCADLAKAVLKSFKPRAQQKRIPLRLYLPDLEDVVDPQFRVLGDRRELGLLLSVLVRNAVKFTSQGHVDIYLNQPVDSDGRSWLAIEVADTGVGIPQDLQKKLVAQFKRTVPPAMANGLKLYLAQHITEAHQGTLQTQSLMGRQTVFTLLLPAYRPPSHP
jgi:two-component system, sensor histidine kinase and response regulator